MFCFVFCFLPLPHYSNIYWESEAPLCLSLVWTGPVILTAWWLSLGQLLVEWTLRGIFLLRCFTGKHAQEKQLLRWKEAGMDKETSHVWCSDSSHFSSGVGFSWRAAWDFAFPEDLSVSMGFPERGISLDETGFCGREQFWWASDKHFPWGCEVRSGLSSRIEEGSTQLYPLH